MKRRASKSTGEWLPTPMSVYIDEIIQEENAQRSATKIMNRIFASVKIRAMHNDTQMSVEFDMLDVDAKQVKEALIHLRESGFVRPVSNTVPKQDNAGKTGVVTSVTKREGKEQWDVVVKLDEVGAGEQKFISFSAKEYRKGDVVRIEKNAKGYTVGVILDDETRPTKTDDIPF